MIWVGWNVKFFINSKGVTAVYDASHPTITVAPLLMLFFYPNNLMISCSVQYSFYHSSWTIHNSLLRCQLKLICSSIFPVCFPTAYHFSTGKYICIDIFYFGAAIIICSTTAFFSAIPYIQTALLIF